MLPRAAQSLNVLSILHTVNASLTRAAAYLIDVTPHDQPGYLRPVAQDHLIPQSSL
jgi:hypothetical protein